MHAKCQPCHPGSPCIVSLKNFMQTSMLTGMVEIKRTKNVGSKDYPAYYLYTFGEFPDLLTYDIGQFPMFFIHRNRALSILLLSLHYSEHIPISETEGASLLTRKQIFSCLKKIIS